MIACDSLLCLFFRDLVGLGGHQSDEFHAAFYEQIAGFLTEGYTTRGRENLADDLLDGCYIVLATCEGVII